MSPFSKSSRYSNRCNLITKRADFFNHLYNTLSMKTRINTYLTLFLSLAVILSLSVTGCEGPAGADGSQGTEGPTGPVGPAGENGSVIHAGQGAPDSGIGNPGDYYLDTQNILLYGPKTEGNSWGTPIDLKGADGQDGADGSQIFSGTTAPDASLGSVGDFYLNTSNFDLFGPKTPSGWGTPVNLQATTNVMYSAWFGVVWNEIDDPDFKQMRIPESRITREFFNSGGNVFIYVKQEISSAFSVVSLPFIVSETENLSGGAGILNPPDEFNGVVLAHQSLDGSPLTFDFTEPEFEVRYVLIPGSQQIGPEAAPQYQFPIDMDNYEEVAKYYGFSEKNTVRISKQ